MSTEQMQTFTNYLMNKYNGKLHFQFYTCSRERRGCWLHLLNKTLTFPFNYDQEENIP